VIRRCALTGLMLVGGMPAGAQEARLQARMDRDTYAVVRGILDSARKAGLPTRPIEDKALEGASAGAASDVIVTATRAFAGQLSTVSRTLGKSATTDELRAGVGAIDAGVPPRDLVRIDAAADPSERSIATALTVLGDIVVRGVPVATASSAVISLLRARVRDAELLDFAEKVRSDISHGADPGNAASARAKSTILTFGISKEKPKG
jgi:hypothetical protein